MLPAPGPFNFSELSNRGAAAARGTILLFLNNDIEVLEPTIDEALAMIADGRIRDAKTIMLLQHAALVGLDRLA